jgi:hypothetical protein
MELRGELCVDLAQNGIAALALRMGAKAPRGPLANCLSGSNHRRILASAIVPRRLPERHIFATQPIFSHPLNGEGLNSQQQSRRHYQFIIRLKPACVGFFQIQD